MPHPAPIPPTFRAGHAPTAAQFNQLGDALNFRAKTPRCKAYLASPGSIPNGTYTVITLDAEDFDVVQAGDDPAHDNATDNTRIYIRTSGKYLVAGQVEFAANGTGTRKVTIRKNAGGVVTGGTQLTAGGAPADAGVTMTCGATPVLVALDPGDYVEMFGHQTSGGALTVQPGSGNTWLSVEMTSL